MWKFLAKNKNDIIYLVLLILCVLIGPYYRSIKSVKTKKWIGSLLGFLLIVAVSGTNALHPLIAITLGIASIRLCSIRFCHVLTFFVMFGYLFFFRLCDKFGFPAPTGQTNLIVMILVLRIVGVAFEINGSWLWIGKGKKIDQKQVQDKDEDYVEIINPSTEDLVHYSFNYIGLLTGPYCRYRTFDDYFKLPFSKYADCLSATLSAAKCVPLYVSLYIVLNNFWPLEYALSEEHNNSSFLYKMLYPWMVFAAFRQRIYSGMVLAECVCTSAGLGAYPVQGKNRAGHGPSVGYLKLKQMNEDEAKHCIYDFNTIESMDVWGCETAVTLRESMKVWNKAVQYWVATCVFKRFPFRPMKIHATLFVSVIWHGFMPGYFFCIYFCPFYILAEDIFYKLYYKNAVGLKRKVVGFTMWFLRTHSESYQAMAFLFLTFDRIWKYYSSMHHYWYWTWLAFLILGLILNAIHRPKINEKVEVGIKTS